MGVRSLLVKLGRGPVAAIAVGALILGGGILEFAASRQEIGEAPTTAASKDGPKPPLAVQRTLRLTARVRKTAELDTVDGLKGLTVVALRATGGQLSVQPVGSVGRATMRRGVSGLMTIRPDVLRIGTWEGREKVILAAEEDGTRLRFEVRDLELRGRPLAQGRIATPKRSSVVQRSYALERWSGTLGDLWVVDRSPTKRSLRLRILSGESSFRDVLLDLTIPRGGGFPPNRWWLQVKSFAASDSPDLVFISRTSNTASREMEVHALSGASNFSQFQVQTPTDVPAAVSARRRALVGVLGREPVVLSIDIARQSMDALGFH